LNLIAEKCGISEHLFFIFAIIMFELSFFLCHKAAQM